MTELDHVIWAVPSLDTAIAALRQGHGLAAVPGGSHPAWGTRNAIVPLGGAYLELVEVADPDAPMVGFTARIAEVAAEGGGLALWCERTDDIGHEAAVRGYDVVPGSRENPDGSRLSWRVAGMPQACATPLLPFLIQWDDPAAMPGAMAAHHPWGAIDRVHLDVGPHGPSRLWLHSGDLEQHLP